MSESDRSVSNEGFELDLGRLGLIVIVPVGFWAFYTTFQGLKDVTRQGSDDLIVGTIGALIGSAAILSLMALSSWKLGTDAAAVLTGRGRFRGSNGGLVVLIPSFLFFLSLSAFFSYTYYHTNFFGLSSRQMEGERQPRALANAVIPIIDGVILRDKKAKIQDVLASQGAISWERGIDALIKAAGTGGKRFEDLADESTRKMASDEATRLKAVNSAREQIGQIKAQVIEQQRVVKAAGDIIDPHEPEIARLKEKAASEDALARAAARGLDKSKTAICGSICLGHQENARQARGEISRIEGALKEQREHRLAAQKKIEELNLKLPELERIAGIRASAVAIPAPTAAAAQPPASAAGPASQTKPLPQAPAAAAPLSIKDHLAVLSSARDAFLKDPSTGTVTGAATSCKTLLATARELKAAGDVSTDFDCTIQSDETRLKLEELDRFRRDETTYNQQCGPNQTMTARLDAISSDVRIKKIQPPEGLVQARLLVQQCTDLAAKVLGRSGQLQAADEAMENFVNEQSLDRNRFTNATAHLRKFDGDARLALAVALAQDLLILIYKFLADYYKYSSQPRRAVPLGSPIDLSDNEDDPAEIRARKALLRVAKPFRGNSSQISDDDIRAEQLPEDVESNLRAVLNSLGRSEAVWQIGKGVLCADNDVLQEIESALQQSLASGNATAARSFPAASKLASVSQPAPSDASEGQPAPARRTRRSIRDFATRAMSERATSTAKSYDQGATVEPDHKSNIGRQQFARDKDKDEEATAPPVHTLDEMRKMRS